MNKSGIIKWYVGSGFSRYKSNDVGNGWGRGGAPKEVKVCVGGFGVCRSRCGTRGFCISTFSRTRA